MNIALSQREIATFLGCTPEEVADLWLGGTLRRSIFAENRRNPDLSHSSVYDVLEHYLRSDVLVTDVAESEVEAWMTAVEELVESTLWHNCALDEVILRLLEFYHDFSGASGSDRDLPGCATRVVCAYFALLGFVQEEVRANQRGGHLRVV